MLRVIAVLCFLAVAVQQGSCGYGSYDDHPALRDVQKICQKKVSVTPKIYQRALKGDMETTDRDLQCYTKCIFETANAMDKNGKIDLTGFINGMKPEAKAFYGPKFLECQAEINDKDKCKKAMKMYQCFQKKTGPKYYFV